MAVSCWPSEVICQSTLGERSIIGSEVPTMCRPSRSRSHRTSPLVVSQNALGMAE
ncbi:hypothetical protein AB0G02_24135 [Actinosynnema sp. NPDC023658]|uniref:hypothetical protein n=1 Tax=Actinosynnema sp. NPDC023658 TaxID=3155465 RepID=UPI003406146E